MILVAPQPILILCFRLSKRAKILQYLSCRDRGMWRRIHLLDSVSVMSTCVWHISAACLQPNCTPSYTCCVWSVTCLTDLQRRDCGNCQQMNILQSAAGLGSHREQKVLQTKQRYEDESRANRLPTLDTIVCLPVQLTA